jgi:hypothetical protein
MANTAFSTFWNEVWEPEELTLNSARFCGPSRAQFRTSLFALNRSTRLSEIKTGRVGAIGIDGRAPKIEGEESEERVPHSAKGFMFVGVNILGYLKRPRRE